MEVYCLFTFYYVQKETLFVMNGILLLINDIVSYISLIYTTGVWHLPINITTLLPYVALPQNVTPTHKYRNIATICRIAAKCRTYPQMSQRCRYMSHRR